MLLPTLAIATTAFANPQVMVLGTFHFANPGLDAVKVKQRDIFSADRQKEIASLVESLAKFRPTQIFVEATPDRQADLDRDFAAYQAGTHTLTANETQQVGFRLAKQFGCKGVVAVDYKSGMDFDSVMQFAMKNGMPEVPQRMGGLIQKLGVMFEEWDRRYTVSQILAIHNQPAFIQRGQALYTDMLAVGKDPDYPGADLLAGWYRRNLVIYDNIRRRLNPDDRVLVIYGSGHVYYLNQMLGDDEKIDLIPAAKFLPKPPITSFPDLD